MQAGAHVTLTGTGSSTDPFVIAADTGVLVVDTDFINLTVSGLGTALSPWTLQANLASTAQLGDIPDVNAPSPTNGQVLGWDTGTSRWTPRAATSAAPGAITHDTSLTGDGSGGSPLQVQEDAAGYLTTSGSGLGLTNAAKNSLVRHFSDSTARAAVSPTPTLNALSTLDTAPGRVDYWTGSQWLAVPGSVSVDGASQQLLALSGAYVNGMPTVMVVRNFVGTTASDGTVTVLDASLIASRAGVLSASVVVTGAQAYLPVIGTRSNSIYLTARRVDDGTVLIGQTITGQVTAYVY